MARTLDKWSAVRRILARLVCRKTIEWISKIRSYRYYNLLCSTNEYDRKWRQQWR